MMMNTDRARNNDEYRERNDDDKYLEKESDNDGYSKRERR